MRFFLATFTAQLTYILLSFMKGGGSTLPGFLAEKIQPNYLSIIAEKISAKTVVVSGTNGKTTTTKLIADSLSTLGFKVLSNSSGSNFTRGIITTLACNYSKIQKFDYIVLEVDEAYAPIIAKIFEPEILVTLNVFRDQLDRYGELDTTASHLYKAALFAKKVISNGNEKYFDSINGLQKAHLIAASSNMQKLLPSDDNLYKNDVINASIKAFIDLTNYSDGSVTYTFNDEIFTIPVQLDGVYNAFNLCFAVATLLHLDIAITDVNSAIQKVEPAFGRGEVLEYKGKRVKLLLSKNPAGFNHIIQQLKSDQYDSSAVAVVINDNIADGKDVSWLWDVTFEQLDSSKTYHVAGTRKLDMALRLKVVHKKYSLHENYGDLLQSTDEKDVVFITTYTAMNEIRQYFRDNGVKIGALS